MIVVESMGQRLALVEGDTIQIKVLRDNGEIIVGRLPIWKNTKAKNVNGFINRNLTEKSYDFGLGICDGETGKLVKTVEFEGLQVYDYEQ